PRTDAPDLVKRWNGWGDESIAFPLPAGAAAFLGARVGAGAPQKDAALAPVLKRLPRSRLTRSSLARRVKSLSTEAETRLRHARGQSLPDWIALRSGRVGPVPDAVATPETGAEVRALLLAARRGGLRVIPYGGATSVVGHVNPAPGDAPVVTVDLS